jgi:hypothetical protein
MNTIVVWYYHTYVRLISVISCSVEGYTVGENVNN